MEYPQPPPQRMPWMSKRDREFILSLLMLKPYRMDVLEYGAGWSTAFFSQYAGRWVAVEHDRTWIEKLRPHLSHNVTTYNVSEDSIAYINSGLHHIFTPKNLGVPNFDLVIVDGRNRNQCLEGLLHFGKVCSWIILVHDARRKFDAINRFPYHAKVGDDLYICMFETPIFTRLLKEYDERDVDALSVPWDKSHIGEPGFVTT